MRRLILLRHAKAESGSESGGDFERALTERGLRDAAVMGRGLAELGMSPDRVLVSTARRARETWQAMASAFPNAQVDLFRELYLADPEQIAEAVASANESDGPKIEVLLVVGHNPGLHEYAISFLDPGPAKDAAHEALLDDFPTASAAVFVFDDAGRGVFQRQLTPGHFGGGML